MFLTLLACVPSTPPVEAPSALHLDPAGSLDGVVLDRQGQPIGGALVTTSPRGREATTDAEGGFSIARLEPGLFDVVVAAEGYEVSWTDAPVEVGEDAQAWLELVLDASSGGGAWLGVLVLDPSGEPWPGAEVTASWDEGLELLVTDEQGEVRFEGLGGLTVEVQVTEPDARLMDAEASVEVPELGGELLSFRLAGRPAEDAGALGSSVCALCHEEIAALLSSGAHGQGLGELESVPWLELPSGDGLVGGPLRGAVATYQGEPLEAAWIPAHPERGDWSGLEAAQVDWPPEAVTAQGDCQSCHTTGAEQGVSCERCHGAGSEHLSSGTDQALKITNPRWLDAERANAVCAECHSNPELETWPSGVAALPNSQSDELPLSGHGHGDWQARCTDCHDPHDGSLVLEQADNSLCMACHEGLDFPDRGALVAHTGHPVYAPADLPAAGRCTGCHMPESSAKLAWNGATGAGDSRSHLFLAVSPAESVADFDAAGAESLPAGSFTPNACSGCHAWNDWLFDRRFPGPTGDPTLRATHEELQSAFEGMWP